MCASPSFVWKPLFYITANGKQIAQACCPLKTKGFPNPDPQPIQRGEEGEREAALNLITSSVWFLQRQIMTRKIQSTGLVSWHGKINKSHIIIHNTTGWWDEENTEEGQSGWLQERARGGKSEERARDHIQAEQNNKTLSLEFQWRRGDEG